MAGPLATRSTWMTMQPKACKQVNIFASPARFCYSHAATLYRKGASTDFTGMNPSRFVAFISEIDKKQIIQAESVAADRRATEHRIRGKL